MSQPISGFLGWLDHGLGDVVSVKYLFPLVWCDGGNPVANTDAGSVVGIPFDFSLVLFEIDVRLVVGVEKEVHHLAIDEERHGEHVSDCVFVRRRVSHKLEVVNRLVALS